jgi:8-oxo-dGTP pyrophosphatase MutT (NUDIX family)
MPGGGIKPGETPEKAAEREVREETGIRCHAVPGVIKDPRKPGVAFVVCTTNSTDWSKLEPNHEFITVGFFAIRELKGLRLYHNVKELIEKAKRRL